MSSAPPPHARPSAETCDVLIIGGGPAGSTMATLLARAGRRVVMLEKARHPRFHIGESLLPANGPLLDALGARDEVERMGMTKWGVEFVSPGHAHHSHVDFAEAWRKDQPHAWQVRRDEFDALLFRNAQAQGAHALQDCQVQQVQFEGDGALVGARLGDGQVRQWRARYVVDASGRDTLLSRQLGIKRQNPRHASAALFGHFDGAERLPGRRAGNISIFWFQHGWFWFIPLSDGSTSVGAVCWPSYLKTRRQQPLKDFFLQTVAQCPALQQRLQGAQLQGDAVHATGNYSYSSTQASGPRHVLLGDAYAFVDPVFSSGVYLAMASAFQALPLVQATLDGAPALSAQRRRFEAHMRQGPRVFSWFILRMTNPAMRELFMHPRNVLRSKEAVMSVLAGDVFGARPYRWSLAFFKCVYWVTSLLTWPRTWAAWRARRRLLRQPPAFEAETVLGDAR